MKLTHRILAGVWLVLAVPAVLLWKDSVLFVIIASLYANIMASIAASEASNDEAVLAELKALREQLKNS